MGVTEVLTIVFVVLKLLGKINWPWIYVLLPEIIGAAIYVIVSIVYAVEAAKTQKAIRHSVIGRRK